MPVPRILLVEDDQGSALVTSTLLTLLGCPFDHVTTGEDAVNAAMRGVYSVILMDLQLPDIGGIQATQRIRRYEQEHRTPPIRIIAISAHCTADKKQHCLKAGMDDYINKFSQSDELAEKLAV